MKNKKGNIFGGVKASKGENIDDIKPVGVEEKPKPPVYKDPETKEVMYGYSQQDMNEVIKQQRRTSSALTWLILVISLFFFAGMYILYRVESGNILANIVSRCIC